MKRIKREYSNARTPQQNKVTERKNKTLIEADRTMLADSLLPITFWDEAVNTTCYVLNRALVINPHNKTLYELLNGRSPRLDIMRPFGYPVTILNTLDPLGKFKGKANEGFLVGYSVTSKAFRVFNTKTRKVKENLHVRFLKNKPNVARTGPNWLFDIDSLTNSTNYIPVSIGNQTDKNAGPQDTNGNAGNQDNVDVRKEVSDQHHIVLPLWSSIASAYKSSDDKAKDDKPKDDTEKEVSNAADSLSKEFEQGYIDQRGDAKASSANSFNTVSNPVNAASTSRTFSVGGASSPHPDAFIPDDTLLHVDQDGSQIPNLEDTAKLRRIGIFTSAYDDDLDTFTSSVQSVGAEADFNNMESSTIISPIPTHRAIGTKSVYMNKKDERGIVVRNKARLVAQGHIQEEGIDYDEVFAPVTKIEAIKIFLAFASFMGFIVYQMDVKSAFLYDTIEEKVYVSQPPGFIDPQFPNKIYKNGYRREIIDKTLFIKTDKDDIMLVQVYVDDIIFGSTKKSLCDEFEALMHKRFQMSSMGELTFFLGLQVKQSQEGIFISQDKFQVTPKLLHLHVVKQIFRRLISWQCKKQTIVATSTTEAEDSYEKKLIQVLKIHTKDNVANLLTKAFDVSKFNFLKANIGMLNL
nr:putative ribonuclease H-like domain-containing protein [Tanacetum cinerariifolium]